MNNIDDHIAGIFHDLKNTNLVLHNDISQNSISEFKNILNRSIPTTDCENNISVFIRYLYRLKRNIFMQYLYAINKIHYVLYTDGLPITIALKLRNIIIIKWDNNNKMFDVKPYVKITWPQNTKKYNWADLAEEG